MDYEEGKTPGEITKTGFITIIVLCLLAIGAISYFAISGMRAKMNNRQNDDQSYRNDNGAYNSNSEQGKVDVQPQTDTDIPEPSSSTNKNETEIPYETAEEPEAPEAKRSFIFPVKGDILKGFSDTALQYSATYNDMRIHTGIDILCGTGTDIKSVSDGTVISVNESVTLGRTVTVDYGGDITVKYCGLESLNVTEGAAVKCGEVIGTCGTVPSEANDQPHVHIEVYQSGIAVSPLDILAN